MTSRLLRAVERGLVEPLADYGFIATGGGGQRGETVECSNGFLRITVSADWLEGELTVELGKPGQPSRPISEVLDLTRHSAFRLSRLPRDVSVGSLEARLRPIATALESDASDWLADEA